VVRSDIRMGLVGLLWFGVVCSVIAACVAMEAAPSTTAFLLLASLAPGGVVLILGLSAPAPMMGVWLYGDERRTRVP
jgi:hypothetical protein